jgi:hypothetical protein
VQLEEAHRVELAKRDAAMKKNHAEITMLKTTDLAKRDDQKEKDAEISRLKARLNQFEHMAVMMSAMAQPATAAAGGSSKKRSRQGTTSFFFQLQPACCPAHTGCLLI